jgi:hypothetical protein
MTSTTANQLKPSCLGRRQYGCALGRLQNSTDPLRLAFVEDSTPVGMVVGLPCIRIGHHHPVAELSFFTVRISLGVRVCGKRPLRSVDGVEDRVLDGVFSEREDVDIS